MKTIFLLSILCIFQISLAQKLPCGTDFKKEKATAEELKRLDDFNKSAKNARTTASISNEQIILIPVVVHVIWNTYSQSITDGQVCDLIKRLNEDFSRTNPDANQTPSAFLSVASNPRIQFYLTNRDINGNFTTGITRTQTSKSQFIQENNDIK